MTQGERIKEIRKTLGLTLDRFGERVGLKKSSLSSVENGRNSLSDQLALAICREFHVNPAYLEGTSEEMFLVMTREEEIAAFMGDVLKDGPDSFRQRFIAMLAGLDPEDWKVLEAIVEQLKKD